MEGSVPEDLGAPESWEAADLDETMRRLMLQDSKRDFKQHQHQQQRQQPPPPELLDASVPGTSGSVLSSSGSGDKFSEDAINQVDQFLREALQNPRERLSILRMEQDVEKFIRDPSQQQLEFQQLPTSYLRLAAHRVAQHYSLQSMVLLDNSLPDGSGSKIIVRKTPECSKLPLIRLADIPASFPTEGGGVFKVAIKQRPQQQLQKGTNSSSNSSKTNSSKSVEERKEEYNRARARIFNSSNSTSGVIGKSDGEQRLQDGSLLGALGVSRIEEKLTSVISDATPSRFLIESSTSSDKLARTRTEKDPIGRGKSNNRVAIFRDHEIDRKDPDYDRSYDRYLQRFDPGFGFNSSPYAMQPMYTPALNYNTEFPQLGSSHRPLMSAERQSHPISQHLPGPWAAPSTPAGIGYSHPDTTIQPFNPNHVGTHSTSAIYLNPSPYPSLRPGITFIHPHAHLQPFTQSLQQSDANLGLARPR